MFDRYQIKFNDVKQNIEMKNKVIGSNHLKGDMEFKRRKGGLEKAKKQRKHVIEEPMRKFKIYDYINNVRDKINVQKVSIIKLTILSMF